MKLLDERGRLFGKVSLIDILVVAVLAAAVATAVFLRMPRYRQLQEDRALSPVYYQVLVWEMADYAVDDLKEGDKLFFDEEELGCTGEIIRIDSEPGTSTLSFDDGTMAVIEHPETYNLLLTVKGEGRWDGKFFLINGEHTLGLNASRSCHTAFVTFSGSIVYLGEEEPEPVRNFAADGYPLPAPEPDP